MIGKKTYLVDTLHTLDGVEVKLCVDWDKLTPEVCTEINDFWTGSEERLDDTGGDVQKAVLNLLCVFVMNLTLETLGNPYLVQKRLEEAEGWPPKGQLGVTVLEACVPDLCEEDLDITEVTSS